MAYAERRRALFFLRLESAAQERELMSALGVAHFGKDALAIVDQPALEFGSLWQETLRFGPPGTGASICYRRQHHG